MTIVSKLMVRNVVVVSPRDKVVEAARKMGKIGVSSLVVTEGNKVKGIVTRSDFIERVVARGIDSSSITIGQIMTKKVKTIRATANIMEALRLMKFHRLSQLPVLEGNKLVGIIALRDALNHLARYFLVKEWRQE